MPDAYDSHMSAGGHMKIYRFCLASSYMEKERGM
jgi:hypothetical protein